ncbi:MAG: DUF3108 domain-containing protein [Muribaculaceae bacterium]|nr:DUF3108 domain-containing protein [Muribaculaceae bacterium]
MKRLIFSTLVLVLTSLNWISAISLPDEDLKYKVTYKWGLINTQAGRATLSLRNNGNKYKATLIARTEPWADRIFSVRDTLYGDMTRDFTPTKYVKIAHEDGKYIREQIDYIITGNNITGNCSRYRIKKGDTDYSTETRTITATGTTVDMISVFYHLRTLDFPSMKKGETLTLNIFSGKKKELLSIKYEGNKIVKIDDNKYETYHVSFKFASEDGKKSSDGIDTWISADNRRIPIKLEGCLPIGKIRCLYIGG